VLGFPPVAPRVSDSQTPSLASTSSPAPGTASSSATDTAVADHIAFLRLQKKTAPLGTDFEQRYSPGELLQNPPFPKDVTLELLLASQAHMGHHTSRWNPSNARHVAGVRGGIHIIDLEATAAHLRRAARVVERVAHAGGLLLFVGTRKGQAPVVVRAAELAGGGACHLFDKWTPGTITNRDRILEAAPLQVVDEHDAPLRGFDSHLQTRRPVVPDLVICLNPRENYTLLYECGLTGIPTIGVIDTDADPTMVTYVVPANDDRSVLPQPSHSLFFPMRSLELRGLSPSC
jgi:small subunit ribosomal protein S2